MLIKSNKISEDVRSIVNKFYENTKILTEFEQKCELKTKNIMSLLPKFDFSDLPTSILNIRKENAKYFEGLLPKVKRFLSQETYDAIKALRQIDFGPCPAGYQVNEQNFRKWDKDEHGWYQGGRNKKGKAEGKGIAFWPG